MTIQAVRSGPGPRDARAANRLSRRLQYGPQQSFTFGLSVPSPARTNLFRGFLSFSGHQAGQDVSDDSGYNQRDKWQLLNLLGDSARSCLGLIFDNAVSIRSVMSHLPCLLLNYKGNQGNGCCGQKRFHSADPLNSEAPLTRKFHFGLSGHSHPFSAWGQPSPAEASRARLMWQSP